MEIKIVKCDIKSCQKEIKGLVSKRVFNSLEYDLCEECAQKMDKFTKEFLLHGRIQQTVTQQPVWIDPNPQPFVWPVVGEQERWVIRPNTTGVGDTGTASPNPPYTITSTTLPAGEYVNGANANGFVTTGLTIDGIVSSQQMTDARDMIMVDSYEEAQRAFGHIQHTNTERRGALVEANANHDHFSSEQAPSRWSGEIMATSIDEVTRAREALREIRPAFDSQIAQDLYDFHGIETR